MWSYGWTQEVSEEDDEGVTEEFIDRDSPTTKIIIYLTKDAFNLDFYEQWQYFPLLQSTHSCPKVGIVNKPHKTINVAPRLGQRIWKVVVSALHDQLTVYILFKSIWTTLRRVR